MEQIILIIHSLITFLIFSALIRSFFKYRDSYLKPLTIRLAIIGVINLVLVLYNILWLFGYSEFTIIDFIYIFTAVIIAQLPFILSIFSKLSQNKSLNILLLLYFPGLFTFFISFNYLSISLIAISFFIFFIGLIISKDFIKSKKTFIYGLAYFIISLISLFLSLFRQDLFHASSTISLLVFLLFIHNLIENIYSYKIYDSVEKPRKNNYLITFSKYFAFIIFFTSICLMSTIVIHEFGHVVIAKFFDCEYKTIFFKEGSYPYTEVICSDSNFHKISLLVGGPLLPIIFAIILLLFAEGYFMKEFSILMIGFNFIASSKDLTNLSLSSNLIILFALAGLFFLTMGVISLSNSRFEEVVKDSAEK